MFGYFNAVNIKDHSQTTHEIRNLQGLGHLQLFNIGGMQQFFHIGVTSLDPAGKDKDGPADMIRDTMDIGDPVLHCRKEIAQVAEFIAIVSAVKFIPEGNRHLSLGHGCANGIYGGIYLIRTGKLGQVELKKIKGIAGNIFRNNIGHLLDGKGFAGAGRAEHTDAQRPQNT